VLCLYIENNAHALTSPSIMSPFARSYVRLPPFEAALKVAQSNVPLSTAPLAPRLSALSWNPHLMPLGGLDASGVVDATRFGVLARKERPS